MKITLCGSLNFSEDIKKIKERLASMGHEVLLPASIEDFGMDRIKKIKNNKELLREIQPGYMKKHFDKIENSDSILVINLERRGIKNYIGGNTFAEIMVAFFLNKKIFLLNPIPTDEKLSFMRDEIEAVKPIVINGNLDLIKN